MRHTILCVYYTNLCATQLLFALFNYRLYCHIDIEEGLAIAWSAPFALCLMGVFTPASSP